MRDRTGSLLSLPTALAVVAALALAAQTSPAQDANGRTGGGTTVVRPKPKPRPKKTIRIRPVTDVERVPTSSVIIRSQPDGAEVFVDGKLVGTTAEDGEVELGDMRFGPHLVVLRKESYREWSQTITLKSPEPVEVRPLLQSLKAPLARDLSKIASIAIGNPSTGQLTREDVEATDGSGFYKELRFRLASPEAFLVKMTANGFTPALKIVDDDNRSFAVLPIAPGLYETVTIGQPGTYYLRISSEIDESSFVGGDYSVTLLSEAAVRGARALEIGETVEGALEPLDRTSGAGNFYDAWTFTGKPGTRVRITATSDAFTPSLTLLLGSATVSSGNEAPKGKKPKPAPPGIEVDLQAGTYTVYVRSGSATKLGAYRLTVAVAR